MQAGKRKAEIVSVCSMLERLQITLSPSRQSPARAQRSIDFVLQYLVCWPGGLLGARLAVRWDQATWLSAHKTEQANKKNCAWLLLFQARQPTALVKENTFALGVKPRKRVGGEGGGARGGGWN